jgi:hypothetical protein
VADQSSVLVDLLAVDDWTARSLQDHEYRG